MNSKLIILLLVILGIQLIDASIFQDESPFLKTNNVTFQNLPLHTVQEDKTAEKKTKKYRDTSAFGFFSAKFIEKDGVKYRELVCSGPTAEQKRLCERYSARQAVCRNQNYQKEDKPNFTCRILGQKIINKNVRLASTVVDCLGTDLENPIEYDLPPQCQMNYMLDKNDDYDPKDDVIKETTGVAIGSIIIILIIVLLLIGSCLIVFRKLLAKRSS